MEAQVISSKDLSFNPLLFIFYRMPFFIMIVVSLLSSPALATLKQPSSYYELKKVQELWHCNFEGAWRVAPKSAYLYANDVYQGHGLITCQTVDKKKEHRLHVNLSFHGKTYLTPHYPDGQPIRIYSEKIMVVSPLQLLGEFELSASGMQPTNNSGSSKLKVQIHQLTEIAGTTLNLNLNWNDALYPEIEIFSKGFVSIDLKDRMLALTAKDR